MAQRWWVWVLGWVLCGCAVDPPLPLEEDAGLALLRLRSSEAVTSRLALAPVGTSYVGSAVEVGDYTWETPPLDAAEAQRALVRALEWGVTDGRAVEVLGERGGDREQLLEAQRAGAEWVLRLDVVEHRVAWVERDGAWWWANLVLFWGPGVYPVVLIPDEVYEVVVEAEVAVVHPRTGHELWRARVRGAERRSLNDAQRGWSVSGLFFLYPYTLVDEDLLDAHQALAPHAWRDLERNLLAELTRTLPTRLRDPELPEVLEEAAGGLSRTYALVVGDDGPESDALDRPRPLRTAAADARAMATLLRETNTVASDDDLVTLAGAVTPEQVVAGVRELSRGALGVDHLLIYYAGYGRTDGSGRPGLLVGGRTLPLAEVAAVCSRALPAGCAVTFVLDASFGGVGGRTYPGGGRPAPDAFTELLAGQPTWSLIAPSRLGESVSDDQLAPHGPLTTWWVHAMELGADRDEDGGLSFSELRAFVTPRLREHAREYLEEEPTPVWLGASPPPVIVRVR